MRTYEITVSAGGERVLDVAGTRLTITKANLAAWVETDQGDRLKMRAGQTFRSEAGWHRVTVENPHASADLDLEIAIGVEDLEDRSTSDTKLAGYSNVADVADVAVSATSTATVVSADENRRLLVLSNPAGNPREFRIGAAPGAAQGAILNPGDTLSLQTSAEVQAFNPHSAAQSIAAMEVSL